MTDDLDHDVTLVRWHAATFFLLIALALGYWIWFGLTQRGIIEDEGISILMAEGILEHGYPKLPSGFIYHRAYLPGYLLAASIGSFGSNDFAIMLPSLMMATGSLLLTYRFGRDVLRQPVVGLIAAALLVALPDQTFYATSARMYMSLQFFTMLAIYAGWRAFLEGRRRYEWLTLLAIAGAILSHQQGGALLVALPVSIVAIRRLTGDSTPVGLLRSGCGLAALTALFWFVSIYSPEDVIRRIIAHAGVDPELAGLNMNLVIWAQHARALESLIPFGFVLAPLIMAGGYGVLILPRSPAKNAFLYAFLVFVLLALALCANVLVFATRMWLATLPLCLVVSISAIGHAKPWLRKSRAMRFAVWGLTLAMTASAVFLADDFVGRISRGYGYPCSKSACSHQVASEYRALRSWMSKEDRIVATNPWVAHYYLGRVDAVLRQRRVGRSYTFFESRTDEYFGIELIDRPGILKALSDSPRRTWILADSKIRGYTGPRMRVELQSNYALLRKSPVLWVYSNRTEDNLE